MAKIVRGPARRVLIHAMLTLMLLPLSLPASAEAPPTPRIVIIIDDLGYRQSDRVALALDPRITFSVLPHTPLGAQLAREAAGQGREVMLHLPMESLSGARLGPGALTSAMAPAVLAATTAQALAAIPEAVGVNNHMGSALTQQRQAMHSVLSVVKAHNLYFIDSRTTGASVAQQVATELAIPSQRRHIFLDNQRHPAYLQLQFVRLVNQAKHTGLAIGIGHPHPNTLAFLQTLRFADYGVELIPASQALLVSEQPVEPATPHAVVQEQAPR